MVLQLGKNRDKAIIELDGSMTTSDRLPPSISFLASSYELKVLVQALWQQITRFSNNRLTLINVSCGFFATVPAIEVKSCCYSYRHSFSLKWQILLWIGYQRISLYSLPVLPELDILVVSETKKVATTQSSPYFFVSFYFLWLLMLENFSQ